MTIAVWFKRRQMMARFSWTMHRSFRKLNEIGRNLAVREAALAKRKADVEARAKQLHAAMSSMVNTDRVPKVAWMLTEMESVYAEERELAVERHELEAGLAELLNLVNDRRPHLTLIKRKDAA